MNFTPISAQKNECPLFVYIQGQRIRISTIAKYVDSNENSITIWFNTNMYKPHTITFSNLSKEDKSHILSILDYWLL